MTAYRQAFNKLDYRFWTRADYYRSYIRGCSRPRAWIGLRPWLYKSRTSRRLLLLLTTQIHCCYH